MRIAVLGANSQIAQDLVLSLCADSRHQLSLFVRDTTQMDVWLQSNGAPSTLRAAEYSGFGSEPYDLIVNFVGVGDPARAAAMGADIFHVTWHYDDLALRYLATHPSTKYVFLSSGAAYCNAFEEPAGAATKASLTPNSFARQDFYAVAKLHAECRHRALAQLPIVDIRVFNYFSVRQDLSARFFITDAVRAVLEQQVLSTNDIDIVRDYLHPADFRQLIDCVIQAPPTNRALDCYTLSPVRKFEILQTLEEKFGLRYRVDRNASLINATGLKPNYYSANTAAASLGFMPTYSSIACITENTARMLAARTPPAAPRRV